MSQLQTVLDALTRYRTETPLGHQPHMITDLADEAIAIVKQMMQAEPDPFEKYLKEGETPIQRLEREIKDGRALMTVYGKALAQIQELQQQQDTPVAFYDLAHDEDGEIEYEFSVYPRPGFRPLFAQAIAASAPTDWTEIVTVNLVREGVNKHKARELAQHFYMLLAAPKGAV